MRAARKIARCNRGTRKWVDRDERTPGCAPGPPGGLPADSRRDGPAVRDCPYPGEVQMGVDTTNTPVVLGCIAVVALMGMRFMSVATRRRLLHKERMSAIEKGVPLPEDLLVDGEKDSKQKTAGHGSALQGTIWTALGLGMLAASRFTRQAEFGSDMRQFLAFLEVWAYPATFVGVGLLLFAFFSRERKKS